MLQVPPAIVMQNRKTTKNNRQPNKEVLHLCRWSAHTHTRTWCYTVGSSRALAHAWCYSVGSSLAPAHTHTWCTHTWWRFWDCVYQRERQERNVCRSGKKIFIRVLSRHVTFGESMSIFRSRCEPLRTRELVKRALIESLYRDLFQKSCQETSYMGSLSRDLAKRSLT